MRRLRYNNWISIFTLLVVFGILLSGAHADSKKICDYCKRVITDASGVQVENKYYHKSHFICEGCSQSLVGKEFIRKNDNLLCKKCYEDKFTLKCVICGETIQGQYLQRNGQIYHKKCYDRLYGNHCSFCQKIIDGDYLTDFWGNKYHQYHENNEPFCLYCRRFISEDISKGGSVYNDGRNICGICKKTAVDNIREAEKLMSFITQKLNKYGLKIDLTNVELKLVDRNHLANLAHSRNKDFSGFTKFIGKKTQYETVSTKFEIFILHGMPKDRFRATMAHELMHVWLYSYAPMDMDPALTEGSCNYASYLLLQNDRSKEVAYILSSMEKDPDIFYGDGYRRVKKLVRRLGIEAWLDYLKDNKNFPSGY